MRPALQPIPPRLYVRTLLRILKWCTIIADSDAFIVKGLISVLLAVYSGKTAGEILAIDGEAELARLDLASHLSPTRKNGLFAMVQRVRELAAGTEDTP